MAKNSKDKDEVRLEELGKSLLAMPTKPRDDTKFAKKKAKKRGRTTARPKDGE